MFAVDGDRRVLGPPVDPQESQAALPDKDRGALVGSVDGMHTCAGNGIPYLPGVGVG